MGASPPFLFGVNKHMANTLRIIGKNIHLNIAEKEWLTHMQKMFGCTEQEALNEIIEYKREQAFVYETKGNIELARHILKEIDEWDDTREADYQNMASKNVKIIIP